MISNPATEVKQRVHTSRMRHLIGGLMLLISMSPLSVGATVLLQISGPEDTGQVVNADEAVAALFTLTQSFSNVSITAPTVCVSCSGGVLLMKTAIGPTARVADLIAAETFNPSSPTISLTRDILLAPLSLDPGEYFVILAMEGGISGLAGWSGSVAPTITAVSGITAGIDLRTEDVNQGFPPWSNFQMILGNSRLHLLITGDVAPDDEGTDNPNPNAVPEPGSIWLFGIALGALVFMGYTRKKTVPTFASR